MHQILARKIHCGTIDSVFTGTVTLYVADNSMTHRKTDTKSL